MTPTPPMQEALAVRPDDALELAAVELPRDPVLVALSVAAVVLPLLIAGLALRHGMPFAAGASALMILRVIVVLRERAGLIRPPRVSAREDALIVWDGLQEHVVPRHALSAPRISVEQGTRAELVVALHTTDHTIALGAYHSTLRVAEAARRLDTFLRRLS